MFADLDSLEKRINNLSKKAKSNDKEAKEATRPRCNRALALMCATAKPTLATWSASQKKHNFRMLVF